MLKLFFENTVMVGQKEESQFEGKTLMSKILTYSELANLKKIIRIQSFLRGVNYRLRFKIRNLNKNLRVLTRNISRLP